MTSKLENLMKLADLLNDNSQSNKADQPTNVDIVKESIIGKMVVVRTYSAGVYIGKLENVQSAEVLLSQARLIHFWSGAKTTLDIANNGIKGGSLSSTVGTVYLPNAIAIIPMSVNSEEIFKALSVAEYKF